MTEQTCPTCKTRLERWAITVTFRPPWRYSVAYLVLLYGVLLMSADAWSLVIGTLLATVYTSIGYVHPLLRREDRP